jgi:hypothetical protein
MKLNQSILAAVLGLSAVSLANADEIYLTGSTAARAAVYTTLMNPGSVFTATPIFTGFGNKGNGDTYMAFSGTLVGGSGTTVVNCLWSGSEAGIVDVGTSGKTENFMADSLISSTTTSDPAGSPSSTQAHQVDLAMADNKQSYSPAGSALTALTGTQVGVVPFKWVRNVGLWSGTNITDAQIRGALTGQAKLALFSGNASDTGSYVYVAGRDGSSGTRVNAFGESGFGINSSPNQIEITAGTGAMALLTSSHGVNVYAGNYGQSSGGTLAGTMGTSSTTVSAADLVHSGITGYSAVAYLGVGDATTAINAGATVLSYNGIPYSVAAIEQGTYTFWGNEYVYETPYTYSGQSANVGSVYSDLISTATGISAQADNSVVISLSAMNATRTGPTTDPTHN